MNRRRVPFLPLFVSLVAIGVLLFRWNDREAPRPGPAPSPTDRRASESAAEPSKAASRAPTGPPTLGREASQETPPDEDSVEFVVRDGLAIAFGDVILGEPEPGATFTRGWYRMPTPQLWPSREIPYAISPELPHPERVREALGALHRQTPIKFVPLQGEEDAIVFVPANDHCLSYLGRVGGHQPIRLGGRCGRQEILHEILHALGFPHEHSRSDRDKYVAVDWTNVPDEHRLQFAVVPAVAMDTVRGTPFAFQSIMLYPANAFAKDKTRPTLVSRTGERLAPARDGLSPADIERVIRAYGE